MNEKVTKFINDVKTTLDKNSPAILTGIGITGMITTTVLAVKATPKALQLIDNKKMDVFDTLDPKDIPGNSVDYTDISLKPIEVIKVAWKPYIPAVISGTVSVACIIGANSVNAKRNAALATAYKLSEEALSIYKDKVIETIGEKKEKTIRAKVAQEKIDRDNIETKSVIVAGPGTTLCYDSISSRYFTSDMESIRRAINNVNERLISQDYVALNELYSELGLEHVSIGWNIGWNISSDGLIEIDYSSAIAKDGRPCLVLNYEVEPKYDFNKMF